MINNSNNISFCGATRWLKKELYISKTAVDNFNNSTNTEFVGTLPREIIQDIIRVSKNEVEKSKRIKNVMEGFSVATQEIEKLKRKLERFGCYWEANSSFKKEKLTTLLSKCMNKLFKKNKLLKFWEKIKVETLGDGGFGDVFLIKFPPEKQYQPLVFKVFKDNNIRRLNIVNHGAFAENNIMIYVTNLFKKSKTPSVFAQGYFGSLKNNFLVSEYVPDTFKSIQKDWVYTFAGKKRCEEISQILEKHGLFYDDFRSENIIGGKIVDYGGVEDKNKKYMPAVYY